MILAKWTIAFYLEKEMNYIFIFLAVQDPKLNTVILRENSYKTLARELKSAETEVNEMKTVCAHALLLEFSREIEVFQFAAHCSDLYVTLELS